MTHRIQLICLATAGLVWMSTVCGCGTRQEHASSEVRQADVAGFEALMQQGNPVVLDVRTPEEFAAGHIPGAINLNVNDPTFAEAISKLDTNQTHLVYCHSGRRSQRACRLMSAQGFHQLDELAAGFQAWQAAGKPVEK